MAASPMSGNGSSMDIPRSCNNPGDNMNNSIQDGTPQDCTPPADEDPIIDIIINNVVCSFQTRCHLNLKKIAMEGLHVEYRRENGMLNMKLRKPYTTASIWSSGKITCTGATSEDQAKLAARRFARRLQKMGFNVRFINFRVVNVLGTCSLPFGIKINQFSKAEPQNASYEPELHPGVTYRIKRLKATLKIFSTGSITVTAPCVQNVQEAIEHIYPLLTDFKMAKPPRPGNANNQNQNNQNNNQNTQGHQAQEVFLRNYLYPPSHSAKRAAAAPSSSSSSSSSDFDSDASQD